MSNFISKRHAEERLVLVYLEIQKTFKKTGIDRNIMIYGVPRGGLIPAFMLALLDSNFKVTTAIEEADLILDDLVDSGKTKDYYAKCYPDKPFYALFTKTDSSIWYTFFWEQGTTHDDSGEDIALRLLQYIGEDPKRGGLLETPRRFLKAWQEKTTGYSMDPSTVLKIFEDGAEDYDELIVIKDIEIESVCEHHLERIWGVAHIGYIPNGKILGLSKMHRLVGIFGRRLQVQERLTTQIARELQKALQPLGLGVVVEARHACMEARGIKRRGQTTITSSMHGLLRSEPEARAEFLKLASTKKEL